MARTKKATTPPEVPEVEAQQEHQYATMHDVLIMVKDFTAKGYNWDHPLVLKWKYDDEPFVFELVVVNNDKAQLVEDAHTYGVH